MKNIAVSSLELDQNTLKDQNKINSCFYQHYHQVGLLLDTKCPFSEIMFWVSNFLNYTHTGEFYVRFFLSELIEYLNISFDVSFAYIDLTSVFFCDLGNSIRICI